MQQAGELLGEAGQLLSSSLDYDETLAGVAELAVRSLADFCVIDVVENGEVRRLQATHADPGRADLTKDLLKFPLDRGRPHLSLEALGSRKSVLVAEVSDAYLEAMTQGAEHRRILEALQPRSFMAVPLLARGRLLGVILFVSCSRIYDQEDLALAEKLAQFAALEVDNARLYREAQRALQARDRVLGIVAHDLRNPLSAIIMSAQLLLDEALPELQRNHQAQLIVRAGMRMNRLIQDLLDVARLEADQLVLHREVQEPEALAREAVETSAAMAAGKSLSLGLHPCGSLPRISADHDRLLQVLSNLIGNALKFTPEEGSIDVRVEPEGGSVHFSVADTGPGISAENLPRLFQPFWQAERGSLDGAGLGLMIARGIVESHGGRIWAESTPGRGSTFHFTVPALSALGLGNRSDAPADRRARPRSSGGRRSAGAPGGSRRQRP